MVGGRKTHEYPYGKPLSLVAIDVVFLITTILWAFSSGNWIIKLVSILLFAILVLLNNKLHRVYERRGLAVLIPDRRKVVKFPNGTPSTLLALWLSFILCVIGVVIFGTAPFSLATAKIGIVGSILVAILMALLSIALEGYYVNCGRGKEFSIGSSESTTRSVDQSKLS